MPACRLFGRRWHTASDEFVGSSVWNILFRSLFFAAAVAVLVGSKRPPVACALGRPVATFVAGVIALSLIGVAAHVGVMRASGAGTPLGGVVARDAAFAFWFKLALLHGVVELIWGVFGGIAVFGNFSPCAAPTVPTPAHFTLLKALLILGYVLAVLRLLPFACLHDSLGRYGSPSRAGPTPTPAPLLLRRWVRWLQRMCLCHGHPTGSNGHDDDDDDVWTMVATAFQELFGGENLVLGDVIAGVRLVHVQQRNDRQREKDGSWDPESVARNTETALTPADLVLFADMRYFFDHALAVYGWPLLLWQYPGSGCCKLGSSCGLCCQPSTRIHEDGPCGCHAAALLAQSHANPENVLYASFHNAVCHPPFYVAVDHGKKTVVLVVRGTLSTKDLLTDALVAESQLPCLHGAPSAVPIYVHTGFLRSAMFIRSELQRIALLNGKTLFDLDLWAQKYRLLVTGHSLGAGVSAVLAMLLRQDFDNLGVTVQCYAFSPPGATVCETGAVASEHFITSMAVGWDMVPRLSMRSLRELSRKMLGALASTQQSKFVINGGFCGSTCFPCCVHPTLSAPPPPPPPPPSSASPLLAANTASPPVASIAASADAGAFERVMRVPGRIIHLSKSHSRPRLCGLLSQRVYTAVWRPRDFFSHLAVNGRMMLDHFPEYVYAQLQATRPDAHKPEPEAGLSSSNPAYSSPAMTLDLGEEAVSNAAGIYV